MTHPALIVPGLQGLDRSIYETLLRYGESGLSQTAIMHFLDLSASSQSTVSRSTSKLITMGLVERTGSTRSSSFHLTPEARWFAVPSHFRRVVDYDPGRFAAYEPNVSPWLDPISRSLMVDAVGRGGIDVDPSTYTQEIAERFLIEMSWASSALEGNTYSLPETEALIMYGEVANGKTATEAQMILNHKVAIGWVIDNVATLPITADTVFRLHAMLMRTLVRQDNLGRLRRDPVSITTSAYRPSSDAVELAMGLTDLCWKVTSTEDPFEAAFALSAGIAYLQPFIDGNKRTGRLLSSIPLLKAGLPPISFIGINRADYGIGMTTWYELADPTHLGRALAEGYALTAPSYQVASISKRVPRSIEIRMVRRFNQALADYLFAATQDTSLTAEDFASSEFSDLEGDDFDIIVQSFSDTVDLIDTNTCLGYGVDPELVAAYLDGRRPQPTSENPRRPA